MKKHLIGLIIVLTMLIALPNSNGSEKKSKQDHSQTIKITGQLKTIEPGLVLSSGRHIKDIKGRRVVIYTLDEFKIVLKIFNNYVAGRKNTAALNKIVGNYKLHIDIYSIIVKNKDKQIEAYKSQAEFNEELFRTTKEAMEKQSRRNKLKLVFGVIGGAGLGVLCGFLLGAIAT